MIIYTGYTATCKLKLEDISIITCIRARTYACVFSDLYRSIPFFTAESRRIPPRAAHYRYDHRTGTRYMYRSLPPNAVLKAEGSSQCLLNAVLHLWKPKSPAHVHSLPHSNGLSVTAAQCHSPPLKAEGSCHRPLIAALRMCCRSFPLGNGPSGPPYLRAIIAALYFAACAWHTQGPESGSWTGWVSIRQNETMEWNGVIGGDDSPVILA